MKNILKAFIVIFIFLAQNALSQPITCKDQGLKSCPFRAVRCCNKNETCCYKDLRHNDCCKKEEKCCDGKCHKKSKCHACCGSICCNKNEKCCKIGDNTACCPKNETECSFFWHDFTRVPFCKLKK